MEKIKRIVRHCTCGASLDMTTSAHIVNDAAANWKVIHRGADHKPCSAEEAESIRNALENQHG